MVITLLREIFYQNELISISFPPLANFLIPPDKMYEGLVDSEDWYEVSL